jgi:hypothetical protein
MQMDDEEPTKQEEEAAREVVPSQIKSKTTNDTTLKTDNTMDLECDGDLCYPKFF